MRLLYLSVWSHNPYSHYDMTYWNKSTRTPYPSSRQWWKDHINRRKQQTACRRSCSFCRENGIRFIPPWNLMIKVRHKPLALSHLWSRVWQGLWWPFSIATRHAADYIWPDLEHTLALLGDSGGVVNSLDFCPASLKSLGCFYFRCVLSSQWKVVTVNLRISHCQL